MKTFLKHFTLATALLATLTSCSSTESNTTTPQQGTQTTPETNQTTNVGELEVLRVGMDLGFPPFSYMDDNGDPAGLEPVIAKAFGEFLGIEVVIVNEDFSMLIPALETNHIDILIADMTETDERAQKVDFSDPYRYSYTLGLVNKDFAEEHGITDLMSEDDFFTIEGARFVGRTGTKGVYYPQSKDVAVDEKTEIGIALMEISSGLADILIASNEVHGFHAADRENTIVYSGILVQDHSSFVTRKGDTELIELANEFIATMYLEGGLYDQISADFDEIIANEFQNETLDLNYIVRPAT